MLRSRSRLFGAFGVTAAIIIALFPLQRKYGFGNGFFWMREKTMPGLTELLEHLASGAWVEGTAFSYWDRGGPPGRGYESNYLQVQGAGGDTQLTYTKTRFNPAAPPYQVEKYECVIPDRLGPVFGKMLKSRLFTHGFSEEKPLPVGDVTKITFKVEGGMGTIEKTFYERVPEPLLPVQRDLEDLIHRCETEGKKTVVGN